METLISDLKDAIVQGQIDRARELTNDALAKNMAPSEIVSQIVTSAMDVVGDKYACGDYYIPEMLLSARAAKTCLGVLKPLLTTSDAKPVGTVVIGTVKGDLHDIGKNLVAMMLESAGFRIVDLGADVDPKQFISAAQTNQAGLVGMSALLTTTMPQMKVAVGELKKAGVAAKVMVGGAPVTQEYADSIGADGYAMDAAHAVVQAKVLLGIT